MLVPTYEDKTFVKKNDKRDGSQMGPLKNWGLRQGQPEGFF